MMRNKTQKDLYMLFFLHQRVEFFTIFDVVLFMSSTLLSR